MSRLSNCFKFFPAPAHWLHALSHSLNSKLLKERSHFWIGDSYLDNNSTISTQEHVARRKKTIPNIYHILLIILTTTLGIEFFHLKIPRHMQSGFWLLCWSAPGKVFKEYYKCYMSIRKTHLEKEEYMLLGKYKSEIITLQYGNIEENRASGILSAQNSTTGLGHMEYAWHNNRLTNRLGKPDFWSSRWGSICVGVLPTSRRWCSPLDDQCSSARNINHYFQIDWWFFS